MDVTLTDVACSIVFDAQHYCDLSSVVSLSDRTVPQSPSPVAGADHCRIEVTLASVNIQSVLESETPVILSPESDLLSVALQAQWQRDARGARSNDVVRVHCGWISAIRAAAQCIAVAAQWRWRYCRPVPANGSRLLTPDRSYQRHRPSLAPCCCAFICEQLLPDDEQLRRNDVGCRQCHRELWLPHDPCAAAVGLAAAVARFIRPTRNSSAE